MAVYYAICWLTILKHKKNQGHDMQNNKKGCKIARYKVHRFYINISIFLKSKLISTYLILVVKKFGCFASRIPTKPCYIDYWDITKRTWLGETNIFTKQQNCILIYWDCYFLFCYRFWARDFSAKTHSINLKFSDLLGIDLNIVGNIFFWWRHFRFWDIVDFMILIGVFCR